MPTPCINTIDYLFNQSGVNPDWAGDPYASLYSGSGTESNWSGSSDSWMFEGSGTTTDFCSGDRTIKSFTGRLTTVLIPSVTYDAIVDPTYYKVVVLQPPRNLQP